MTVIHETPMDMRLNAMLDEAMRRTGGAPSYDPRLDSAAKAVIAQLESLRNVEPDFYRSFLLRAVTALIAERCNTLRR